MKQENTIFEIANNFEDLKKVLNESINGTGTAKGYIQKMIDNLPGPVRSPMGKEFDTEKRMEKTPDGGFNIGYYSRTSGDTMVSIRLYDNEITLSSYYDYPSREHGKIFDVTIEPTEDGSRSVVKGPAEIFVRHENDSSLDKLFSVGVRNLMKIDGKGENNLTPDMKKQLESQSVKPIPRSR